MKKKVKFLSDWTNPKDASKHAKDAVEDLDPKEADALIELGIVAEVATTKTVQEELAAAMADFKAGAQKAISEALKEASKGFDLKGKGIATGGGDRGDEDPMGGFKCDDEVYLAVHRSSAKGAVVDERLPKIAQVHKQKMLDRYPQINDTPEARSKVAAVGTGESGGFLIPEETSTRILERVQSALGGLLGMCDNVVLSGFSVRMPAVSDADRSAVATRYGGGVIVYNVAEAGQITASTLKFREIRLEVHKKAAMAVATDEMLSAIANFGSRTTRVMGEAIAGETVEDVLFGSGTGVCLGMLNAGNPSILAIAKQADQEADSIVVQNILKMEAFIYDEVGSQFFIYCPEAHTQLALLTLTVGTSGIPLMMAAGGFSQAPATTIRGRLAIKTDHCEALGDQGDIALINPSQYMLATRGGVKTDMSIHLYFDYDKTAFRATYEVDGKPAWETTMKPRKGAAATRISPFVVVAAR